MKTAGFAIGAAICYVWGTDWSDAALGFCMWLACMLCAITEK